MSYFNVLKQVKKNQFAPVFLLHGSENYLIDNLKKEITKRVLGDEKENLSTYDLAEVPIQEVIADVETYPFFGEKKLIIAFNPVFLKARPDKLPFEHDLDTLYTYLENPVDYSILILVAPYEKLDERKKITKAIKKHGIIAECEPVKDKDIRPWLKNIINELQVSIDEDAMELIESEFAGDLQLMESEMRKFALFVGNGGHVTREIVENLISHNSNISSLRLVDAVIEKNLHKAIEIFKDLEKMNEDPIALIGLLAFQFRTILRVKLLRQKGYSQFQIQKQLGVHPYVVKVAMSRERSFETRVLQDIIHQLAETDSMIKHGIMDKQLAFELLLYHIVKPA